MSLTKISWVPVHLLVRVVFYLAEEIVLVQATAVAFVKTEHSLSVKTCKRFSRWFVNGSSERLVQTDLTWSFIEGIWLDFTFGEAFFDHELRIFDDLNLCCGLFNLNFCGGGCLAFPRRQPAQLLNGVADWVWNFERVLFGLLLGHIAVDGQMGGHRALHWCWQIVKGRRNQGKHDPNIATVVVSMIVNPVQVLFHQSNVSLVFFNWQQLIFVRLRFHCCEKTR